MTNAFETASGAIGREFESLRARQISPSAHGFALDVADGDPAKPVSLRFDITFNRT